MLITGGINMAGGFSMVTAPPPPPPVYKLWAWGGDNNAGALGLNTVNQNLSSPTQVGTDTTWALISPGTYATAAIKSDGTLWAWGLGDYGVLGTNNVISQSNPVQVGAGTNWAKVATCYYNTIAIKTDGTLWSWGIGNGSLGTSTTVNRSSPVQVGTDTNWASVTVGGTTTVYAIKTNGTLWAWGENLAGQLGQNNRVYRSSPTQVGALTTWSMVSIGATMRTTMAVKTDGTLWLIGGRNYNGMHGLSTPDSGTTQYRSSPTQIGGLTTWLAVDVGYGHAAATMTNGTLWTWGRNNERQLGQNDTITRSSPVQVGTGTTWATVTLGKATSGALKTDGTIWSWGAGVYGTLGRNSTADVQIPVQIGTGTSWTKLEMSPLSTGGAYKDAAFGITSS